MLFLVKKKKAELAVSIPDKAHFRTRKIMREKGAITIGVISPRKIKMLNEYIPSQNVSKYMS